jgi:hypothetical protein
MQVQFVQFSIFCENRIATTRYLRNERIPRKKSLKTNKTYLTKIARKKYKTEQNGGLLFWPNILATMIECY